MFIAQGLGFKYIWHAGGRFLVRPKGGKRAHVFVTSADLQAIRTACQPVSKQHPPNKNLNNANERQEAAQASESAQASWLASASVGATGDGSFFRAGFLNINSLRSRIERLRLYLTEDPSYYFFGIAESWLGPGVDDSLIQVDGYSVIRQDRNINGGGVALYVRNNYTITKLASSNTEDLGRPSIPEYLFCQVQQGSSPPILIGAIYRRLHIVMQKDTDLFEVLKDLSSDYSTNSSWGTWMQTCH